MIIILVEIQDYSVPSGWSAEAACMQTEAETSRHPPYRPPPPPIGPCRREEGCEEADKHLWGICLFCVCFTCIRWGWAGGLEILEGGGGGPVTQLGRLGPEITSQDLQPRSV